jgi:hypothetical protein
MFPLTLPAVAALRAPGGKPSPRRGEEVSDDVVLFDR